MSAATATTLGVTLTGIARKAAGNASGQSYRDADTGAWCQPEPPHVPGCTCQPGAVGCDACWRTFLATITASAGRTS